MATKDKPKKTKFKPEADVYRKSKIRDFKKNMATRNHKHQRYILNG